MTIPPEHEPLDRRLHVAIPASLEKKIKEYAKENKVRESVAVRHIMGTFLSAHFGKTKESH